VSACACAAQEKCASAASALPGSGSAAVRLMMPFTPPRCAARAWRLCRAWPWRAGKGVCLVRVTAPPSVLRNTRLRSRPPQHAACAPSVPPAYASTTRRASERRQLPPRLLWRHTHDGGEQR
jgi:hypothetical protein